MNIKSNYKYKFLSGFELLIIIMSFVFSIMTSFIDKKYFYLFVFAVFAVKAFIYIKDMKIKTSVMTCVISVVIAILLFSEILKGKDILNLLQLVCCFAIGYSFAQYDKKKDGKLVEKLFCILNVLFVLTGIGGVCEYYFGNAFDTFTLRVYTTTRLHLFYMHPIIFAYSMVAAFIINYYFTKKTILKFINGLIYIFCLIFSLTRFSWICIILTALFIVLKRVVQSNKKIKMKTETILSVLFIILFCVLLLSTVNAAGIFKTVSERWNQLENSQSIEYRTTTINAIVKNRLFDTNILHWLIGTGNKSAQKLLASKHIYLDTVGNNVVDNEWLCVGYDFGLFGLFLMGSLFVKSVMVFFKEKDNTLSCIALLNIINLFFSLTFDSFGWPFSSCMIFVFAGFLMANKPVREKKLGHKKVRYNKRLRYNRGCDINEAV